MRHATWTLVPLTLLAANLSPAHAAIVVLTGNLAGANENPSVVSPGMGTAIVTLDDVADTLSIDVTFSGLLGTTTAAHIHCCQTTSTGNAGVATTTPTFAGFPLGVTSGSFSTTLNLLSASSYNPAFITANGGTPTSAAAVLIAGLTAGRSYLNIHTSSFPSGEIRAPLSAVPEPASWSLMIAGFGATGYAIRRRPKGRTKVGFA